VDWGQPPTGGAAIIDPGTFAAYVFTVVAGVGAIGIIGAVTRRIGGGRYGPRRIHVTRDAAGSKLVEIGMATTDPGQQESVRQLTADVDAMREEIAGLRREMDETLNRLDFTERLLGQVKERGLLNPPKERD
jgi:hypothetical protein